MIDIKKIRDITRENSNTPEKEKIEYLARADTLILCAAERGLSSASITVGFVENEDTKKFIMENLKDFNPTLINNDTKIRFTW